MWKHLSKYRDIGLLTLRLGVGFSYLFIHGWGKITGGPERWERLGGAMANLGIDFFPVLWGFLAACSETLVALFFAIGFFFRPSSAILAFTMLVATIAHLAAGDGWSGASHSFKMFIVFSSFIVIGAGKYSVDR
jgi:putative oxidoreductase